ncbi:hypothetical protein Gohar_003029 [Gossypium harknessii]|uniref:RNase H type-1 domain-containing protein n=1 Tax=Gossypium harknessii TaxID=34285 RepID=A0A7J9HN99_9ROSI|nr:hypothetical protein [Gossypium harknessii]
MRTISIDYLNNPRLTTLHWSTPDEGEIKLNMDGAVSPTRSYASIGGVFRDENGTWLYGFSMKLGDDTVFKVEARAILEGLNLAWDKGFRKLELECDNALLEETILAGEASPNLSTTKPELEEPPPIVRDLLLVDYNSPMLP